MMAKIARCLAVAFVVLALHGCARRDDGMGNVWRGVKQVEERR